MLRSADTHTELLPAHLLQQHQVSGVSDIRDIVLNLNLSALQVGVTPPPLPISGRPPSSALAVLAPARPRVGTDTVVA